MTAPSISAAPRARHYDPGATLIRRFLQGTVAQLSEREFRAVVATSALQSDGIALVMSGGNFQRFEGDGGPLLDGHDPSELLGSIKVRATSTELLGFGRFSSAGVSELADERCRQLKDGVLKWFSVGFVVHAKEPLPGGGWRATRWELYEVSLTPVPVDPDAKVTARHATHVLLRRKAQVSQALQRAREAARLIAERNNAAFEAHARGDMSGLHRQLRAVSSHTDALEAAHDQLARELNGGTDEHDPRIAPTAAAGAQTSAGQSARSDRARRQAEVRQMEARMRATDAK